MRKRVLFLDIDGVLNSEAYWQRLSGRGITIVSSQGQKIDPDAVKHLNRIVHSTHCTVVLSSSWRLGRGFEKAWGWLKEAGYTGHLHDRTSSTLAGRGAEISEWLSQQPPCAYAILDDEPELKTHEGRWVHTPYATGLTAELADRAIALLMEALHG